MATAALLMVAAMATASLDALRGRPPFEAVVAGRGAHEEVAYGSVGPGGELAEWAGWAGERDVALDTPAGRLTLSPRRIRLYMAPSNVERYDAGAKRAPAFVREWLAGHGGPVEVRRWRLVPGARLHALVAAESYWLPPAGPQGEPREREALVLWLSDVPFVAGEPQRPLTPRGAEHRY